MPEHEDETNVYKTEELYSKECDGTGVQESPVRCAAALSNL